MEDNAVTNSIIINFVLKGGPPWGFRIKARQEKVFISKVNCGGRAYKIGLKVNDEIVAVNNFDISQHPLATTTEKAAQDISHLSRLDFTFQLIKHTLNRILHLTVKRHSNSDISQPCFYCVEEDRNRGVYHRHDYHSQSEEEIFSPSEEHDLNDSEAHVKTPQFVQFTRINRDIPIHRHLNGDRESSEFHEFDIEKPLSESSQSEMSEMPSLPSNISIPSIPKKPSFKAKAPKNIWSPGSTTTESNDSISTIIAFGGTGTGTAAGTQTTPVKSDVKSSTLPHGFRPVRFVMGDEFQMDHIPPSKHLPPFQRIEYPLDPRPLISPTSMSETSLETACDRVLTHYSPPPPPLYKYWSLPSQRVQSMFRDDCWKGDIGKGQKIETKKAPPANAKFLYEDEEAKYFAVPTTRLETTSSVGIIPPPLKYEGVGPLNEVGIPLSLRTGVKEEYREDWYKKMFKRLHKFDRPKSDLDEPLRVKLRSNRRYHLDTGYLSEDENINRISPRNIADYEPGKSSISLRERQKESSRYHAREEMGDKIDADESHEIKAGKKTETGPFYHPNCVFNNITSTVPTNGYESDSSYIIKKKEKSSKPASRSTYNAVQRGDDIPLKGLQKPAPQTRAHHDSPHKFDERSVNIHYTAPIRKLLKKSDMVEVKGEKEKKTHLFDDGLDVPHRYSPLQDDSHVVPLDRYSKAYSERSDSQIRPSLLAKVLFDFHALSSREISLQKGDIVLVHRAVNQHWTEVEDTQSGLKGLVPRSYLDYEQDGVAKAKFDFNAKTPIEIDLKKGEIVKLVKKVDNNWYEGVNSNGNLGIFPCSYVDTQKLPLTLQLNNNTYVAPTSGKKTIDRETLPMRPQSPFRDKYGDKSGSSKGKLYRVLYPYKPHQTDELELLTGDLLTVTMHCDDGWFVGHSTLTGQYGTFPGNYVELIM